MNSGCKKCNSPDAQWEYCNVSMKSLISQKVNIRLFVFHFPLSISNVLVTLGLIETSTLLKCTVCNTIVAICPYCMEYNNYNIKMRQRCDSCNKKFYNYI